MLERVEAPSSWTYIRQGAFTARSRPTAFAHCADDTEARGKACSLRRSEGHGVQSSFAGEVRFGRLECSNVCSAAAAGRLI